MSFDLFVQSCIVLKRMTDVFKRYDDDRDGYITLSFEEFLTGKFPLLELVGLAFPSKKNHTLTLEMQKFYVSDDRSPNLIYEELISREFYHGTLNLSAEILRQ